MLYCSMSVYIAPDETSTVTVESNLVLDSLFTWLYDQDTGGIAKVFTFSS